MLIFLLPAIACSYNYLHHGTDWPGICNTSFFQSPIDISMSSLITIASSSPLYTYLSLYYSPIHVINSNQSSEITSGFNYNSGINFQILSNFGYLQLLSSSTTEQYSASSISFHYPAEHTFNQASIPPTSPLLEVQIEHISATNSSESLILSVMFQVSPDTSYFLDQVIQSYYSQIGGDIDCTFAVGGWFVIENFYRYQGSETKPGCREGVEWVIVKDIGNATAAQIQFFVEKLNASKNNGNYRYTKPLYGRTVTLYTAEVFSLAEYVYVAAGAIFYLL